MDHVLFVFHAYLWTLKYRIDSGYWSKASQGLDVCLLGQQAPALRVTREGQRAQVLEVQMALPTCRLEKILARHHLHKRQPKDASQKNDDHKKHADVHPLFSVTRRILPVALVQVVASLAESVASLCSSEEAPVAKCYPPLHHHLLLLRLHSSLRLNQEKHPLYK